MALLVDSQSFREHIAQRFHALRTIGPREDDCWGWAGSKTPFGYGRIAMYKGVEGRAHRVSFVLANGRLPAGLVVAHRCDNPACSNPLHLFEGSHADNVADKEAKGRGVRPPPRLRRNGAKLSQSQVAEIRAAYRPYDKDNGRRALARRYGVTPNAIYNIIRGLSWAEAPPAGQRLGSTP